MDINEILSWFSGTVGDYFKNYMLVIAGVISVCFIVFLILFIVYAIKNRKLKNELEMMSIAEDIDGIKCYCSDFAMDDKSCKPECECDKDSEKEEDKNLEATITVDKVNNAEIHSGYANQKDFDDLKLRVINLEMYKENNAVTLSKFKGEYDKKLEDLNKTVATLSESLAEHFREHAEVEKPIAAESEKCDNNAALHGFDKYSLDDLNAISKCLGLIAPYTDKHAAIVGLNAILGTDMPTKAQLINALKIIGVTEKDTSPKDYLIKRLMFELNR